MDAPEVRLAVAACIPDAINGDTLGVFDRVFHAQAVNHSLPSCLPPTVAGLKAFTSMLRDACPDLTYSVERAEVAGDRVTQYLTARGTMLCSYMGMAATGRPACWQEVHHMRITGGKIVEHWAEVDRQCMLRQFGLAPDFHENARD